LSRQTTFQRRQSARSPQQEGETLLASPHGIHACADEIADRFMNRIKNPDRSEIAEAMLQGEFLRVPSVRLDPFTGLAGNRQRRRHRAAVAEIDELSEKAITQPPASLQNAKRRPSLASRLASFATSVS